MYINQRKVPFWQKIQISEGDWVELSDDFKKFNETCNENQIFS